MDFSKVKKLTWVVVGIIIGSGLSSVFMYPQVAQVGAPVVPIKVIPFVPRPTSMELKSEDARRVLEAQRLTEHTLAEMYKSREGRAWVAASEAQQFLYESLTMAYNCLRCDLGWDLKWYPPPDTKFAPPEEPKEVK